MPYFTHNTYGYYNTLSDGPSALGPSAGLVLPEQDIKDITREHHTLRSHYRRRMAWDKWDIYRENFSHLVAERIGFVHSDPSVIAELRSHIDLSINLALDVIKETSALWRHGSYRKIEDVSEGQREAFDKLVNESRFAMHAPGWNELANFLGPTIVVPIIRNARLVWDTLLPHFYDVIQDPADPFGAPQAVVWDVRPKGYRGYSMHDGERREASYIVLDANAWTYLKVVDGKVTEDGYQSTTEIVGRDEHNLGFFPGAPLRFQVPYEGTWWGHEKHRRLIDATINICRLMSSLSFVRKTQDKKLLTLIGDLDQFPKGQVVKPEKGLVADTGSEGTDIVQIDAKDFDTSPDNYVNHIAFIMQRIVASYGGTLHVDAQNAVGGSKFADISFDKDALTEIRNEQIPFARDFEHELWWKSVAMAKRFRHPLADQLPEVDAIKEGFTVQFPKLARSFADPRVEIEYLEWQLRHGLCSYSDLLKRESPTLTEDQAQDRILATIEKQLPIIEAITKRDLSLNPNAPDDPALQTPSQINGAMGPEARDSEPNTNEED